MIFPRWSLFFLIIAASAIVFAQEEYDFEVPIEEERKLEWDGNLDVKYTLFNMDRNSSQYKLQFFKDTPSSSLLSQYRLEPYLNAEYRTSDLGFILKTHGSYHSDEDARFDLFEAYATYNPSFNTALQAGKRVYSWGKGYAFNPVGFINSIKDPENPELAQAGLLSANFEYIKSFSSEALQSFSFLAVIIPSTDVIGTLFAEAKNTDIAIKTSFLLFDTDIDLLAYQSENKPKRFGFDFARNIQENIEVHGEISLNQNVERHTISNDALVSNRVDKYSYLFGLRYLDASNTTIIAEYYHNGAGLSKDEYSRYTNFIDNGANNIDLVLKQQTLGVSQTYFKGTTQMQDYLYLKVSHPEPFDWLYFTPSLFTIYNLADNGFLLSLQMSYKPVTNIDFIFWATTFVGDEITEYGSKQVQQRMELWMRVFF
ncbi:MAG: hypothetical protein A2315_07835 [Ignavibacteria bacterium RIFOXYB2_FULL_35_12]|nr:MAG: hypothetical protein A2058_04885 [Ignavibacteria bacterium GWA2_36_19]OGU53043.1 MAG: hypothetical protein A2006_08625 [Ignavibacteria bacterium GWC2_35_8]OGU62187.1 MAG: hypothetical protein A2X60_04020 [Ignavibacteria bacterium GWF2_35_20]OGU84593.1 MAG: hypothetical protein A3K31_09150 [Ignavibacteria bacterium RIFOXYA12_FULL_35_25]OGU96863.1 MAG: hypothetical protein A2347_14515 [Ignavibacteria bacterium RIFOXYB12_FULL_35_14]OGV01299.1 MAG: hypothetical protein A2455_04565 [Ignavib